MRDILPIAERLKAARAAKGLSQRALAEQAGVPQSHISRIESGAVDLQTSSLIQLARALDLEVSLVPRQIMPAVQSLQREALPSAPDAQRPAYTLDEDGDDV